VSVNGLCIRWPVGSPLAGSRGDVFGEDVFGYGTGTGAGAAGSANAGAVPRAVRAKAEASRMRGKRGTKVIEPSRHYTGKEALHRPAESRLIRCLIRSGYFT